MLAPGHYQILIKQLLAAGVSVAGLHLSGHGECQGREDYVFSDFLAQGLWAEEWLQKNGFGPLAICGHSQGGILTVAHAGVSRTIRAAFAVSAVFPEMAEAIHMTRFAPFAKQRKFILALLRRLASILPGLPVPLPLYLDLGKIVAGKKRPVLMGRAKGRISYPLKYLVSLFEANISTTIHCPIWLFNARNDEVFTESLTRSVFERIEASEKNLIWLENGGHTAPLNPDLAQFIARHIAAAAVSVGMPLSTPCLSERT